jgi:hypothetical protein
MKKITTFFLLFFLFISSVNALPYLIEEDIGPLTYDDSDYQQDCEFLETSDNCDLYAAQYNNDKLVAGVETHPGMTLDEFHTEINAKFGNTVSQGNFQGHEYYVINSDGDIFAVWYHAEKVIIIGMEDSRQEENAEHLILAYLDKFPSGVTFEQIPLGSVYSSVLLDVNSLSLNGQGFNIKEIRESEFDDLENNLAQYGIQNLRIMKGSIAELEDIDVEYAVVAIEFNRDLHESDRLAFRNMMAKEANDGSCIRFLFKDNVVIWYGAHKGNPAYVDQIDKRLKGNSMINYDESFSTCQPTCNGCLVDEKCLPLGSRLVTENIPRFCDIDGKLSNQVLEGTSCQNNFECNTNVCSSGKCIDLVKARNEQKSMIRKIMDWLGNIFR